MKKSTFEVVSLEDQIRRITSWIVDVVLVVILAFFLTWAFGTRVTMVGNSMSPLLESGDRMFVNRTKGRLVPLQRFDVAAYEMPDDDSIYLKLILGLPGETVQIKDGLVYVNNELLEDKRLSFRIPNAGIAEDPILLGEGEFFVIGRSPDASLDSRSAEVGNIPQDRICGTVWLRYSPIGNFGFVRERADREETHEN